MSTKYQIIRTYASDSDNEDHEEIDIDDLPPLTIGPDEHRLQYTYCVWFYKPTLTKVKCSQDYSKSLHLLGRCASVEQWWSIYCHLVRPSQLKPLRELHLFKSGIKPMWEDPGNAKGGKWVIRLRKNKIDRAWENVCMAMLGEQFLVGPEICGVVLSTRYPEDLLSVWNKTSSDHYTTGRIRDTLRRILNLHPSTPMEYKVHCDSLNYIKSVGPKYQPPFTLLSSSSSSSALSPSPSLLLSSSSSSSSSSYAATSTASSVTAASSTAAQSTTILTRSILGPKPTLISTTITHNSTPSMTRSGFNRTILERNLSRPSLLTNNSINKKPFIPNGSTSTTPSITSVLVSSLNSSDNKDFRSFNSSDKDFRSYNNSSDKDFRSLNNSSSDKDFRSINSSINKMERKSNTIIDPKFINKNEVKFGKKMEIPQIFTDQNSVHEMVKTMLLTPLADENAKDKLAAVAAAAAAAESTNSVTSTTTTTTPTTTNSTVAVTNTNSTTSATKTTATTTSSSSSSMTNSVKTSKNTGSSKNTAKNTVSSKTSGKGKSGTSSIKQTTKANAKSSNS